MKFDGKRRVTRQRIPWPIGKKLREAREAKAQSLTQVATAIGGSRAHIWQLEVGDCTNPTVELLQKLGAHLELGFVVSSEGARILAPDERALLTLMSSIDPEARSALVRLAEILAAGARPNSPNLPLDELAQRQAQPVE